MDLEYDFFSLDGADLKPAKGRVLISEPFLPDPYFHRTVILITEHNSEGTIGFVLNRQLDVYVHELIKDFPKGNAKVSLGGPVANDTLHFCHSSKFLFKDSLKVTEDIFWGINFPSLIALISENKINSEEIRFFIGYSGWSPGQLEREISENSWIVGDINSADFMQITDKESWKHVIARLGAKYKLWSGFPDNPVMN